MTEPTDQGELEVHAFTHRVRPFIVFFHTTPPASIRDPNSPSSVGTGFLVQLRNCKYFVSALHNFFYEECGMPGVIESWEAAKFKFSGEEPINFEVVRHLPHPGQKLDPGVSLPHLFPHGLHINQRRDLIAVEMNLGSENFAFAQFLNLGQEVFTGDLQHEMSLVTIGNPLDGRVPISGEKSALIPHVDHVLFDEHLDTSRVPSEFLGSDYFLMPYSLHQEKVAPAGFSGAPIFVQGGSDDEPVWSASPRVVGVVLRHFPKRHTIVAVKIKVVIEMLDAAANPHKPA